MSKAFQDQLLRFSQEPELDERQAIETKLWEQYGRELAVLVLDMSGFSRLTQRYGIVHYLSMVRRMQLTITPIVESYGGEVMKFEADDCFAAFPDSLGAVRAAIAANLAFDAANILTPEELDIRVTCGIDFGKVLYINGEDFFGFPVIRACKLGEDVAMPGEILVTSDAMKHVSDQAGIEKREISFSISGVDIEGFSIKYRREETEA